MALHSFLTGLANFFTGAKPAATGLPTLEAQLETLAEAGLTLSPGYTRDDLLALAPRADYEAQPFSFLFQVLGERLPGHDAPLCRDVFLIDWSREALPPVYTDIVTGLARAAGATDRVSVRSEQLDLDADCITLRYDIDGTAHDGQAELPGIDAALVTDLQGFIEPLTPSDREIRCADFGGRQVFVGLSTAGAARLDDVAPGLLSPL